MRFYFGDFEKPMLLVINKKDSRTLPKTLLIDFKRLSGIGFFVFC